MLHNWLKPLPSSFVKSVPGIPAHTIAHHLLLYEGKELPDLRKVRVAIIGMGEKESQSIREQLYAMSTHFPKNSVADLGNLRKSENDVLIQVLAELLAGKIIPVVIGGQDTKAAAQFLAYQQNKALVNLAVIDEQPRFISEKDTWYSVVQKRHPQLLHFSLIGYQMHQMPSYLSEWMNRQQFDLLRLGRSRAILDETEPYLRDADALALHLSALKQGDAPGVPNPTPSGYFLEEACQLCRYAGMSDKMTSFGVYGFQRECDAGTQTPQAVAQICWYFLDGVFQRKKDYPASTDGLTEYIVDFRQLHYQLTFWKSKKSGRWWMQVPTADKKRKYERHRLVPCSYQDYQAACREELPDRLMAALQRFS
jgi:formiminoglutamase